VARHRGYVRRGVCSARGRFWRKATSTGAKIAITRTQIAHSPLRMFPGAERFPNPDAIKCKPGATKSKSGAMKSKSEILGPNEICQRLTSAPTSNLRADARLSFSISKGKMSNSVRRRSLSPGRTITIAQSSDYRKLWSLVPIIAVMSASARITRPLGASPRAWRRAGRRWG
jgi:hypothetical protein